MKKLPYTTDSWRAWFADVAWELFGSMLIAVALQNFAVPAGFPMGGFSGVSIIVHRLLGLPVGWTILVLNIPVALLCWRLLGKGFLFKSIRCMIISSLLIDYAAPLLPLYQGSEMLAALVTGVLSGTGYAVIYMRRSSTGGADFLIMAAKAKWPHLQFGSIILTSDLLVVLVGAAIFRDIDGLIYAALIVFLTSSVVDKVMLGINSGKVGLIVTTRAERLCDVIDQCAGRGSTILDGRGGYSRDAKQVVMVACSAKEMYQIEKTVRAEDPDAFMIVCNSSEVHGNGFRVV